MLDVRPLADAPPAPARFLWLIPIAALVLFSFDWAFALSDGWFNLRDGVSTVGALRVLAGEVPYRDFWTMYAPGHFYLLAGLFGVFGTHLGVEIAAGSVVSAFAAGVAAWIVFELTGRRSLALLTAAVFIGSMYDTGYFKRLGSYPAAVLFVFLAVALLIAFFRRGRTLHLVLAGLATGVAAVFKHDVAGYTALAMVAGIVVHACVARRASDRQPRGELSTDGAGTASSEFDVPRTSNSGSRWTRLWRVERAMRAKPRRSMVHMDGRDSGNWWRAALGRSLAVGTAALLVVLPVAAWLWMVTGWDVVRDVIAFPLTDFRHARPERYPSLVPFWIPAATALETFVNLVVYVNFAVPKLLVLTGAAALLAAVHRGDALRAGAGAMFLAAFLLHFGAAHVQINTHIVSMSTYAVMLSALLADSSLWRRVAGAYPVTTRTLVIAISAGWLLALAARPIYLEARNLRLATATLALPPVAGARVMPDEAAGLSALAAFVDAHLPPGRRLYAGTHRHDAIVIGDPMIYVVLGRRSLTRYHELHPAIADTAAVQQEIVAALETDAAPLVVLKHAMADATLEEAKRDFQRHLPLVGATLLDDYIKGHFEPARSFGPYTVWLRRPPPGP